MPRAQLNVNAKAMLSVIRFKRKARTAFEHAEAFAQGIASVLEPAMPGDAQVLVDAFSALISSHAL